MLPLLCKDMRQICSEREYYELFLSSVAKDPRSVHGLSETELRRHLLDVANLQHVSYGGADYYCCPVAAHKPPFRKIKQELLEAGLDKIAVPQVISPAYAYRFYLKLTNTTQFVFDFKIPYVNGSPNFSCILFSFFPSTEIPLAVDGSSTQLIFRFSHFRLSSVKNDNKWHRVSLSFQHFNQNGYQTLSLQLDNKPAEIVNSPFYTYSSHLMISFGSTLNQTGFEIKNISALKKSIAENYVFEAYNIYSGTLFDVLKNIGNMSWRHKKLWPKEYRMPPSAPPPSSSNHVVSVDGFPIYVPEKEKKSMVIQIPTKNFAKYGIRYQ